MNFKRFFTVQADATRKAVWQSATTIAMVATMDDVPRLEAARDGNDPVIGMLAGLVLELMHRREPGFDPDAPTPDAPDGGGSDNEK